MALSKAKEPSRKVILKQIRADLDQIYQWGHQIADMCIDADYTNRAFDYVQRAEALIQLLEVHDCGSVGGYDGINGLYSLEERYNWLKNKYKSC